MDLWLHSHPYKHCCPDLWGQLYCFMEISKTIKNPYEQRMLLQNKNMKHHCPFIFKLKTKKQKENLASEPNYLAKQDRQDMIYHLFLLSDCQIKYEYHTKPVVAVFANCHENRHLNNYPWYFYNKYGIFI